MAKKKYPKLPKRIQKLIDKTPMVYSGPFLSGYFTQAEDGKQTFIDPQEWKRTHSE